MDIFIILGVVIAAFTAAVLAWPSDRAPLRAERYHIYGR